MSGCFGERVGKSRPLEYAAGRRRAQRLGWEPQPAAANSDRYTYDDLGNITSKSDFATSYSYGSSARTTRNAGPHAVASVVKGRAGDRDGVRLRPER